MHSRKNPTVAATKTPSVVPVSSREPMTRNATRPVRNVLSFVMHSSGFRLLGHTGMESVKKNSLL